MPLGIDHNTPTLTPCHYDTEPHGTHINAQHIDTHFETTMGPSLGPLFTWLPKEAICDIRQQHLSHTSHPP